MRLRHNLLSKKEFDSRRHYLKTHVDTIAEREGEVKKHVGLQEHFLKKNQLPLDLTINAPLKQTLHY
jgi:hypothetical protein